MDIVDRLRVTALSASGFNLPPLLRDAADEIVRLRASEQAWKLIAKQNDKWNALPQSEKEAALQRALNDAIAENERLTP